MCRCRLLTALALAGACALLTTSQGVAMKPTGQQVLNNFVTELLRAQVVPGASGRAPGCPFANPRQGWVHLRAEAAGEAAVCLDRPGQDHLLLQAQGGAQEAMRYLAAGRHTLYVTGRGPVQLVVRAIPEIIYANFPADPHVREYGPYDWDFLRRCGMLEAVNVLISGGGEAPFVAEWRARGGRLIQQVGVPGLRGEPVSEQEAYQYWAGAEGMSSPQLCGVIADEFYPSVAERFPLWVGAIKRVLAERPGRVFYPYVAGDPEELRPFMEPLLAVGCRFAYEQYLREQRTEREAQAFLADTLQADTAAFIRAMPGIQRHLICVLGILCAPPESLDADPAVSYKVFMDMQFHLLATDPTFQGLGGIEEYLSSYADEEYLRWAARLFRHYCIEGHTDRLTRDPYRLAHVRNPDFEQGLEGWTVAAAEPGSVGVKSMEGFAWLQGRYPESEQGDTFLWLKRSARRPNVVSQEIRGLEPGRSYSLKLFVGDYQELTKEQRQAVAVRVEGADLVAERSFQAVFPNCYSHHSKRFGEQKTYFNYWRLVFRARARTARLSISDWGSNQEPGGPAGQELACNFVQVEPYFMGDE